MAATTRTVWGPGKYAGDSRGLLLQCGTSEAPSRAVIALGHPPTSTFNLSAPWAAMELCDDAVNTARGGIGLALIRKNFGAEPRLRGCRSHALRKLGRSRARSRDGAKFIAPPVPQTPVSDAAAATADIGSVTSPAPAPEFADRALQPWERSPVDAEHDDGDRRRAQIGHGERRQCGAAPASHVDGSSDGRGHTTLPLHRRTRERSPWLAVPTVTNPPARGCARGRAVLPPPPAPEPKPVGWTPKGYVTNNTVGEFAFRDTRPPTEAELERINRNTMKEVVSHSRRGQRGG